jgi:hypothetical protein
MQKKNKGDKSSVDQSTTTQPADRGQGNFFSLENILICLHILTTKNLSTIFSRMKY